MQQNLNTILMNKDLQILLSFVGKKEILKIKFDKGMAILLSENLDNENILEAFRELIQEISELVRNPIQTNFFEDIFQKINLNLNKQDYWKTEGLVAEIERFLKNNKIPDFLSNLKVMTLLKTPYEILPDFLKNLKIMALLNSPSTNAQAFMKNFSHSFLILMDYLKDFQEFLNEIPFLLKEDNIMEKKYSDSLITSSNLSEIYSNINEDIFLEPVLDKKNFRIYSELEKKNKEIKENLEYYKKKYETLVHQSQISDNSNQSYIRKKEIIENDLLDLRKENDRILTEIENLKGKSYAIQNKNKKLKIKYLDLEKEFQNYKKEKKEEIKKLELEKDNIQHKFEKYKKKNQTLSLKKEIKFIEKQDINTDDNTKSTIRKFSLKELDLETKELISQGSFGIVHRVKNKNNEFYAIKTITIQSSKSPEEIQREIEIWEKIQTYPKPKSIINYYGHFEEDFGLSGKSQNLIFNFLPQSLKNVISELKNKKKPKLLPFKKLLYFTKTLINSLAFLQSLKICHRDLKPDNLLLDDLCKQIYLIDFSETKEIIIQAPENTKKELTIAGSPKYFSPEMDLAFHSGQGKNMFNPFKSDVFSFGLIIIEMGLFEIPSKDGGVNEFENNIIKAIRKFRKQYEVLIDEDNEKEELINLVELIKDCLKIDVKKRPDFIDLFIRKMNKSLNSENIRRIIIDEDRQNFKNAN